MTGSIPALRLPRRRGHMNRSARRGQRWLTPTAVLLTACAGGGDESSFGANVQTFSAIGGSGRFSRRVGRDRGATALTPGDVVVTRHQVSPLAATDVGNERPSRSAVYD